MESMFEDDLLSLGSIDLGVLDGLDLPDLSVVGAQELPEKISRELTSRHGEYWACGNASLCQNLSDKMLAERGFISEEDMRMKLDEYVSTGSIGQQEAEPVATSVPQLMLPVFIAQEQMRGCSVDKFFCAPLSSSMVDNYSVLNTLTSGTDEEVEGLPNLCCSCPPVKLKCDTALETMLCVRVTHQLMSEYGVSSLADVLRHVGMLVSTVKRRREGHQGG
jgi:hypothetical protein